MQEEKKPTVPVPYDEETAKETELREKQEFKKAFEEQSADSPETDAEEDKAQDEAKEKAEEPKKGNRVHGLIIGVLGLIIAGLLLFISWQYSQNENDSTLSQPLDAKAVMNEKYAPPLKAKQLNPNKVYQLKSTADSFHGLTIAVTKVQFRQDATRLWVKIDNDSGKTISMIPSANSKLVDNNGRTYKNDPFGGDQVTSIAAGAHEELILVYEPTRENAESLIFSLDGVFDMKNTSWGYSVQFDIP